jgi:hypothetical protein
MKNNIAIFCLTIICFSIWSCKKTPTVPPVAVPTKGNVNVYFNNIVNGQAIALGGGFVGTNNKGQGFSINTLKYYISNVRITDDKGVETALNNFTLIDEDPTTAKHEVSFADLPNGNYTKVTFNLGLDPVTNALTKGTGDLDQSKGMWWNAEKYLFLKHEGQLQKTTAGFVFHVGNDASYLQNITVPTSSLVVNGDTKTVMIDFNLDKIYNNIDIEANSIMMSEPKFTNLLGVYKTNAATAFTFNKIK